jgi:hypothetical protein
LDDNYREPKRSRDGAFRRQPVAASSDHAVANDHVNRCIRFWHPTGGAGLELQLLVRENVKVVEGKRFGSRFIFSCKVLCLGEH